MIKELEILPDVSFIGNTTLESIEAELKSDYEKKYNEITGENLVLARSDPATLILYACAVQFFQIHIRRLSRPCRRDEGNRKGTGQTGQDHGAFYSFRSSS